MLWSRVYDITVLTGVELAGVGVQLTCWTVFFSGSGIPQLKGSLRRGRWGKR